MVFLSQFDDVSDGRTVDRGIGRERHDPSRRHPARVG